MNINPIIILISQVISLYNFVLIVYCVAGWLINFNILNRDNKFVYKVMYTFGKFIEPVLNKVRKFMPDLGSIDISPIVVFLLLNFLRNILFTYFYVK
ncbi:MAG TPA: YggT family protein [Rickettsiales bacterium]|nr:YggT family protein [Rickettsiales bacterium]